MLDEKDLRPIGEVSFAQDPALASELRTFIQDNIRSLLQANGVQTADDLIELGCTGLFTRLRGDAVIEPSVYVGMTEHIRKNMAGAGFGLPCYCPPDRFCFVHNTIGGLQIGQRQRFPEAVEAISRPLTKEETRHVLSVSEKAVADATVEAEKHFHLKREAPQVDMPASTPTPTPAATVTSPLTEDFRCPEHSFTAPEWRCRFCLAAAIIHGPYQPFLFLEQMAPSGEATEVVGAEKVCAALENLTEGTAVGVFELALFVRVAGWKCRLVRE